jgi:hypothetical protein
MSFAFGRCAEVVGFFLGQEMFRFSVFVVCNYLGISGGYFG